MNVIIAGMVLACLAIAGCETRKVDVGSSMFPMTLHIPGLKPARKDPAELNAAAQAVLDALPRQPLGTSLVNLEGYQTINSERYRNAQISAAKEYSVEASTALTPVRSLEKQLKGYTISFAHPFIGEQDYKFLSSTFFFGLDGRVSSERVGGAPYRVQDDGRFCIDYREATCFDMLADAMGNAFVRPVGRDRLDKVVLLTRGDTLSLRERGVAYERAEQQRIARDLNVVVPLLKAMTIDTICTDADEAAQRGTGGACDPVRR
jgi:hypothetical protein